MDFDIENTTWWKTDGSDHFKVRSVFFDDKGMQVQTYDGRMIPGDVLQNYIQSEVPINPKPKTPPAPKINRAVLLQGMGAEELGDVFVDEQENQETAQQNGTTPKGPFIPQQIPQESANDIIIKRMIDNLGYPEINFTIDIDIDPEYAEKLKTSAQVMGIEISDIKNYMCRNIKDEDIRKKFTSQFSDIFDIYFGVAENMFEEPNQ